jgi:hypothetical protein
MSNEVNSELRNAETRHRFDSLSESYRLLPSQHILEIDFHVINTSRRS